ncbi:MAG: cysteine desulfurase [Candidatus Melainabacteria bacterium]|nr:cysteine desulfurase [Candidatus Melainabacteria bacterium]
MFNNTKMIYVDNSATTRVRPEVVEAMLPILKDDFGNPSSMHGFGRKAKKHLDDARINIASVINSEAEQIFFTSGGTESDNAVIFGLVRYFEENEIKGKKKHIITSKIEHPAIKEPLECLQKDGWHITWLNVNREGFLDLNELQSLITKETLLVSVIHANNEMGTIQDLNKISNICKTNNVLFHTDAVQSFGKIPINVKDLQLDFLSMSAHKIYGPKGVGALYIKSKDHFAPLLIGGGQENQIRPGTENLASIVGFGIAGKLLKGEMSEHTKNLCGLQIELMKGLSDIENVMLTGPSLQMIKENTLTERYLYRIPGHISICVRDVEGENIVLQADLKGIAASSGSACSSGTMEPSHVLVSLGVPHNYVRGSLRLTLGRENTEDDVRYIIESVKDIAGNLQRKALTLNN